MPISTSLPLKENSLFKRAMRCYENKQYKNGIKFVNQILANPKFSEHGETLAIKGLLYYCLGKKEEAYDLVRRGLKVELKSYLCWHTYGIIHRSDKNYEEAIKCFRNALKWDVGNTQILQDLSVLQVQIRDFEGYLDTRHKLFQIAPTQRAAWAGFAIAYHLNKDYDTCLQILDAFRRNLTTNYTSYSAVEYSELLLYENMVIEESGNITGAVDHLTEYQVYIRDKVAVLENFSRFYLKLKKYKEAENYIQQLYVRNPDRNVYYHWLFEALGLKTNDEKVRVLTDVFIKIPRARLPQRMCLDFVEGETFSLGVGIYLRRELHKGVPSLFVDIRHLYKDTKKLKIIEELVLSYKECLLNHGTFLEGSTIREPPTTIMWVYYFLAQHFCYKMDTDEALSYIDLAILHTPTLADLYIAKGKIFKKAGNFELAAETLIEAKNLDSSDRFINSKCAYYLFKADKIALAEEVTSSFTGENTNVMDNITEMQCLWYLLECALAHERLGNYGDALMKCHEIDKHFVQFYQDQFDFHSFCLRGMSLKPYIYLLRFEEEIKGHYFYKRAAHCAIRVYIQLHDSPKHALKSDISKDEGPMTSSELKKIMSKERKAKKKAQLQKVCDDKPETKSKSTVKRIKSSIILKSDLNPESLQNTPTPLEEAIKFLLPLISLSAQDVCTYLSAFEIYFRKGKVLLMLQSIKRGYSIEPNNAQLHEMIIRFTLLILDNQSKGILGFPFNDVINSQMEPIWKGRTPSQINEDFISENKFNLNALLYAARSLYVIDSARQNEALELCTHVDDTKCDISVEVCTEVLKFMQQGLLGPCETEIEQYITKCHKKFPFATIFMPTELKELNISELTLS